MKFDDPDIHQKMVRLCRMDTNDGQFGFFPHTPKVYEHAAAEILMFSAILDRRSSRSYFVGGVSEVNGNQLGRQNQWLKPSVQSCTETSSPQRVTHIFKMQGFEENRPHILTLPAEFGTTDGDVDDLDVTVSSCEFVPLHN